uniref:Alpha-aminoadipic semialdehyde synthase n=1 Tax=Schistocephalus solidus TaxID=70667 RepID=A0A0V0J3K5_SCHSO
MPLDVLFNFSARSLPMANLPPASNTSPICVNKRRVKVEAHTKCSYWALDMLFHRLLGTSLGIPRLKLQSVGCHLPCCIPYAFNIQHDPSEMCKFFHSFRMKIVSNLISDLENVKKVYPNISVKQLDILQDTEGLGKLVAKHDLVMSMVPWKFHPQVFAACIQHKRNVLTASYCSPALRAMEQQIKDAGITAFMEIGLDPGIDHLLAMECFDETYAKGGKVISYESYTGGLPAPEYADNPLRYKFSWSPEAAMTTVLNGATYLKDGEVKQIPPGGALMDYAHPMNDLVGFNLEGYPNRDSTSYKDIYKLKDCHTVIRGTLRYKGFTKVIKALIELGFMDQSPHPKLAPSCPPTTWKEVTCMVLGLDPKSSVADAEAAIRKKLNMPEETVHEVLALGLLSDKKAKLCGNPFATLSTHFSDILAYGPNERDLIVMSHQIGVEWPDKRRELKIVRLVIYGEEGKGRAGLAMSRTVGLPAAIAALMVLNGEVKQKGFVLPFAPELYKPILERLKKEGIEATETTIAL